MTKKKWITKITLLCQEIGTYDPSFDLAIENAAKVLEKRDKVESEYNKKENKKPVIEYTNKNGSTNIVKNPLIVLWGELNRDALTYLKELGLTPAGLKKIKDSPGGKTPTTNNIDKLIKNIKG